MGARRNHALATQGETGCPGPRKAAGLAGPAVGKRFGLGWDQSYGVWVAGTPTARRVRLVWTLKRELVFSRSI